MKQEQITATSMLPEPSAQNNRRARKAGRKIVSASTIQKAWLVLLAALAMTVLEGAFRKWVFPSGGALKYLLYFSKDIIFALVLLFPKRSLPSPAMKVFGNWLIPGCVLLGAGAVLSSPHGLNPVGALLTARACVILPVIAWLAVPRLAGLPLRWVIWLLVAFTVLNFALGVEQNRLPSDHILNRYSETGMDIVAMESGVRATGTFSYITGMTIISSVGIWAGLSLMSLAKKQWQRIGAWPALAAGFGCGLASISRGPIVVGVAMVAGWMVCSRDGLSALFRSLVTGAFCLVIASGLGVAPIFSELGAGVMQRQANGGDTFNNRAFGQFGEMFDALEMAPLGHGFGTEQIGGQYYATGQGGFNHFESPLPRLVMETGVLGLIGYLVICAGALLALQRAKREAANVGAKAMLLATQFFLLPMFYGNVIFNHTASAFVWIIFAAVLAAAETNEKAETLKTESRNQETKHGRLTAEDGSKNGKRRRPRLGRAIFSATAKRGEENAETPKPENGKEQPGREPLNR
jgi:hypothetical protein